MRNSFSFEISHGEDNSILAAVGILYHGACLGFPHYRVYGFTVVTVEFTLTTVKFTHIQ